MNRSLIFSLCKLKSVLKAMSNKLYPDNFKGRILSPSQIFKSQNSDNEFIISHPKIPREGILLGTLLKINTHWDFPCCSYYLWSCKKRFWRYPFLLNYTLWARANSTKVAHHLSEERKKNSNNPKIKLMISYCWLKAI